MYQSKAVSMQGLKCVYSYRPSDRYWFWSGVLISQAESQAQFSAQLAGIKDRPSSSTRSPSQTFPFYVPIPARTERERERELRWIFPQLLPCYLGHPIHEESKAWSSAKQGLTLVEGYKRRGGRVLSSRPLTFAWYHNLIIKEGEAPLTHLSISTILLTWTL